MHMDLNFTILLSQINHALKPMSYKKSNAYKSNQNKINGSAITEHLEWGLLT